MRRAVGIAIFAALVAAYFITKGDAPQSDANAEQGGETAIARQPIDQSPALKAAIAEQSARDVAANSAKVKHMSWSADYGVMIASFTFSNPSDFDLKDMAVSCDLSAPSGTRIGTAERTVYEIVPARSEKTVARINMGFVNSQAKKAGCIVRKAVPTAYRPKPTPRHADSASAQ